MWTPRRILLLFLSVIAVGAVFLGYTFFLGHFDGLQTLPEGYRPTPGDKPKVLVFRTPPTITLLQQAFGKNSPEGNDSKRYPNRIPIPGRDGVIACGAPQPNGSAWVRVSPVSVLLYSRPTLAPKPGESLEFSTFHGDEAMLQFDRPIDKVDQMSQAKVIAIELRSKPDVPDNVDAAEPTDVRRGRIWVTNNRKSTNPADHIVFRLSGKLIVQLPDENTAFNPDSPHIWSEPADALVEMFDRQNMPYKLHEREAVYSELNTTVNTLTAVEELTQPIHPVPPLAALPTTEDLRKNDAIRDILSGNTLPPPTIVAYGMKIYLAPADKNPATPAASKKGGSFGGVRQIVLGEKVQIALWTDGTSGFPGSEQKTPSQQNTVGDPARAFAAALGVMHDANVVADRVDNRSLLLLTTPGLFKYDLEQGIATFDMAAHNRPGEDNFVLVSRLSAKNQTDDLICNRLVIEQQDKKNNKTATSTSGLKIKALTATGPQVILSVQAENLEASGVEIKYTRSDDDKVSVITLKGSPTVPVIAKRDGSKLTAGDAAVPAKVEITTTEGVLNGKPERISLISVLGPGRMDLLDRANATPGQSGVARWGKALRHEKQLVRKRIDPAKPEEIDVLVDLLKFEENAAFVDSSNGFNLRAEQSIWLWVSGGQTMGAQRADTRGNAATPAGANPERLVATGNVKLDSEDLTIRRNNKLTVVFNDVPAPKLPEPAKPVAPALLPTLASKPVEQLKPLPTVVDPKAPALKPDVAKKPLPNPMKLESDTIETTLARYSVPVPATPAEGKNPARPATTKKQYEMRYARCDDNVHVVQDPDPNDPKKPANGTDITGNKLILTSTGANSSVMTVTGGRNEENWAKVSFEGTTIHGPTVEIDQPNNAINVPGKGRLTVASGSNLTGQELSSPSDLAVTFQTSMNFQGAKAFAQFIGEVKARQIVLPDPVGKPGVQAKPGVEQLPAPREAGPVNTTTNYSDLICHQLELTLDRPVYFNQLRGTDRSQREANTKPDDRPKLKAVVALPLQEKKDDTPPTKLYVYYRELSVEADGTSVAKGRLLTAKQLDFANREKEQELFATGPGELRLLQPDNGEVAPVATADPNKTTSGKQPVNEKAPLKLTLVKNWTKMVAKDQGNGLYQEAKFDNGARVLNAPADELTMTLESHALPKGSMQLECDTQLLVTTSKKKKDAPSEQRLTAIGNAVYIDDNRTGLGEKITYDGIRVLLESEKRMASLSSNKKSVNQQQETRAKKFVYNSKTGDIDLTGSSGGSLLPDR